MHPDSNQTKTFPHSCTKKELQDMYLGQMSEADIRKGINEIIRENRKGRDGIAVQRIWPAELSEFVEIYGLPKGFHSKQTSKP